MKFLKRVGLGIAVGGMLALLWLVGGNAYARYRKKLVERAWVQSFGPLQKLLDRCPKTTTNETARRLEKLAEPLGLDLAPTTDGVPPRDTRAVPKPGQKESEEEWQAVSRYLTSQLEKPEAGVDRPPKEVEEFFAAHGRDLRALATELAALPAPRWDFDPSIFPSHQPIPSLRALILLQRALLAGALVDPTGKNLGPPGQTLEASWRLNQALSEMPQMTSQLIAIAIARMQMGALRKMEVDASLWRARLAEHDFKRSVLDTGLLAQWPDQERSRQLEEIYLRSEKNLGKRVQAFFLRPWQDVVWSEVSEKLRLAYLRIQDAPLSDARIPERKGATWSAAEILLSIHMPNLLESFRRVDRLVLDAELTGKILQARQLRLQNGSEEWPAAIPGIEVSRLRGAKWIYSISPQGTMSLSLAREPHWDSSGLVLPCRFTSSLIPASLVLENRLRTAFGPLTP
jgi:hypothetical protein